MEAHMNDLKIFENTEFGQMMILIEDGKELFPASQVAVALGYTNPHDALLRHCRSLVKREVPHPQSIDKTIEINFIPEGDLYRLIVKSQLPAAERFERWVFDEVLPSIRKHGVYATPVTSSESEARLLRAKAMEMNARTRAFKAIMDSVKNKVLSPVAEALFGIKALGQITGDPVDYKPEIPPARDLASIAKDFGVPASCVSVIGKLVKARGIQTEEYTITVLNEVPGHNHKQVPQRLYKPEALPIIREVCEGYLDKKRRERG